MESDSSKISAAVWRSRIRCYGPTSHRKGGREVIEGATLGTPGASRCVLEETREGLRIAHCSVEIRFIFGNSVSKLIKPIDHKQLTR